MGSSSPERRAWLPSALLAPLLALMCATPAQAVSGGVLVADGSGVIRVNPATGARTAVSQNALPAGGPSFVSPLGIALAGNGDILVADPNAFADSAGGVIRVDPATGARTTVSANAFAGGPAFEYPSGIALAGNGDILVADQDAFAGITGGVIRIDSATGARTTVSQNALPGGTPSFFNPIGIALAGNGDILVADRDAFGGLAGGVIRVNPTTGARTTVSENAAPAGGPSFAEPSGIALAGNGDILVADPSAFGGTGGVIRVNPTTGARTTISANAFAGGPSFADPAGIALAANGDILVSDFEAFGGTGGVIRVKPTTGARTTVSQNAAPAGGASFVNVNGIAVEPTVAAPPDTTAPGLSQASVSPRTFAVDPNGSAEVQAAKRKRAKKGTTFSYRLTEGARVVFTIERKSRGRKVGTACRKKTRKNRRRRHCTRFTAAGSFAQQGKAGGNQKPFSGKIASKRLRAASYRATLVATDNAGNRSKPASLSFKVVKR